MASSDQPQLPNGPYRELTTSSVILGILQGIILNVSFVYATLQLGFSIGGSTVAAIMGYVILRKLMQKGTMVENNINQTIASGINTAGTGVVFTVPALFIITAQDPSFKFDVVPMAVAGIAGAILGVVVIIPLRKQMIELDNLRFPSGVATATIIRAGSTGVEKAKLLALGVAVSAAWKLVLATGMLDASAELIASRGVGIAHEELVYSFNVIPDYLAPVISLSLMNIAAGLLAGRGGLPFFAGGIISWWIISPTAVASGWVPEYGQQGFIYGKMLRPLGIGVLIGGALMGVVMAFPAIRSAFVSLASATKSAGAGGNIGGDELKLRALIIGCLVSIVLFFIASLQVPGVTFTQAVISAAVGSVWLALAALIVAQATGMTDISPMSGMSLISVTLMMFLLGGNIAAAMVVGVAVCVAIGQGADMMQDLKTGHMIGARPIKQQTVQFCVTWIGALVALFVIYILWAAGPDGANGFGPNAKKLTAPQGAALAEVINGIKSGNVPVDKYVIGGTVGALLGAAPYAGLGVLVGLAMYLPFSITAGYGVGCLIQMALQKVKGVRFSENKLVPFAAGLIVGEALTGISHTAFMILANQNPDAPAIVGAGLVLVVLVVVLALLVIVCVRHLTQERQDESARSSSPLKLVAFGLFGIGTAVAVIGGAQYPELENWLKDNPKPEAPASPPEKKKDATEDKQEKQADEKVKSEEEARLAPSLEGREISWPESWPMYAGGLLMGLAGLGCWYASQKQARLERQAQNDTASPSSPLGLLKQLPGAVHALQEKSTANVDEISSSIESILDEIIFPFQTVRGGVVEELGFTQGSEVLVVFAYGERMLNRSMSAAMDGHLEESRSALNEANAAFIKLDKQLKTFRPTG